MSLRVHTLRVWNACAYLIESESGLLLVDTGWPHNEPAVLRRMRLLRREDLRLIFITHSHLDHYGSAAALRRLTGAPIAIHHADAEAMARGETPIRSARGFGRLGRWLLPLGKRLLRPEPTSSDIVLDDGDGLCSYGLDAVVVHTPGHTSGSCCLLVEGHLAFVGDLLMTDGKPVLQRLYADDWSLLSSSLARVQALRPEWVYAGHGLHPLRGEALQALGPKTLL